MLGQAINISTWKTPDTLSFFTVTLFSCVITLDPNLLTATYLESVSNQNHTSLLSEMFVNRYFAKECLMVARD